MEYNEDYSRVAHYLSLFDQVKQKVSDEAVAMAIVDVYHPNPRAR